MTRLLSAALFAALAAPVSAQVPLPFEAALGGARAEIFAARKEQQKARAAAAAQDIRRASWEARREGGDR